MDGTYTATGKSTKTGGLPGTPSGTPPGGVLGGPSPPGPPGGGNFPPGGRKFRPPRGTVRGQEKPENCRFWGFLGFFREKGHFGRFPISNPTRFGQNPPLWCRGPPGPLFELGPPGPEIDPPGVGHPGGEKVHIFEGI